MKTIRRRRGSKQSFISLLAVVVMQGPLQSGDAGLAPWAGRMWDSPAAQKSFSEMFPGLMAGTGWRFDPAPTVDREAGSPPMAARLASWATDRSVGMETSRLEIATDARSFLRWHGSGGGPSAERVNVNSSGHRGLRILCRSDEMSLFDTTSFATSVEDLHGCAVPLGPTPAPYPMPLWWTDGLLGDWSPAWASGLRVHLRLRR